MPADRIAGMASARGRRGSVLILVVALLVLMALLGTAYISTTRIDRQTSAQHTKNVQIDMLVQGVVNQVTAKIQGDLYNGSASSTSFRQPDSTSYRDPNNVATANNYDDYDGFGFATPFDVRGNQIAGSSPNVAEDSWLASRMPWMLNPTAPFNAAANPPIWRDVSYPLATISASAAAPGRIWAFDAPDSSTPLTLALPFQPDNTNFGQNFTAKPRFIPTYKTINGVNYPAFTLEWLQPGNGALMTAPAAPFASIPRQFLAADTDGDGIADAGLVKLPIGEIDGVTYYYATRIVDNNSALNVNSAFSNVEFDGNGAPQAGPGMNIVDRYYTPASEGLAELLRTTNLVNSTPYSVAKGTEMQALANYWQQGISPNPQGVRNNASNQNAISDAGAAIPGYQYQSIQDAFSQLLGVRPDNPGTFRTGATPNIAQGFSSVDTMSLAYHFGLRNPFASPSQLESVLSPSVYQAAPNFNKSFTSYAPNDVGTWFSQNFYFDSETAGTPATYMPRRTMLVASNPVSWQAPVHQIPTSQIPPAPNTYQRLDPYVLASGMENYLPNTPAMNSTTPPVPVTEAKVSINQAPFGDLWRAFFNVMAEQVEVPALWPVKANTTYNGSPEDLRMMVTFNNSKTYGRQGTDPQQDPPTFNDPYLGTTFNQYSETTPATSSTPTATNFDPNLDIRKTAVPTPVGYHPARMFRSPMRAIPDPAVAGPTPGFNAGTPRLDAHQVMLLRSAIAAVNAEDLRDSDDDVTAKRIVLWPTNDDNISPGGGPIPADAIVYGTEREPFITEVYVDTDDQTPGGSPAAPNQYGYVAIELYNPYDQDITLANWKLVAIDRRNTAATGATSASAPPYFNKTLTRTASGPTSIPPAFRYNLVLDASTLIADFDPDYRAPSAPAEVLVTPGATPVGNVPGTSAPLVVPAHGYLLLENYYDASSYVPGGSEQAPASAEYAHYRPKVTGLPPTGSLTLAPVLANAGTDRSDAGAPNFKVSARPVGVPRLNVACVPGLSGMTDVQWDMTHAPEWGPTMSTGIRSVLNRELVILRPRRADGQYSYGFYPPIVTPTGTIPALAYDERPNLDATYGAVTKGTPGIGPGEVNYSHLRDLVPVDSFDFTGLTLPQPTSGSPIPEPLGRANSAINPSVVNMAEAWHYCRQNVDSLKGPANWKFVYPGRYSNELNATMANTSPVFGAPVPHQQGTQVTGWNMPGDNPWDGSTSTPIPTYPSFNWFSLGEDPIAKTAQNDNLHSSFPTSFQIPLACFNESRDLNVASMTYQVVRNTAGESPVDMNTQNHYPFGGFARDGDILATPYIGAYTIRYACNATSPGTPNYGSLFTIAEMNPVTMDSVFAEDTDVYDDPDSISDANNMGTLQREEIGRFVPIRALLNYTLPAAVNTGPTAPDYTNYPSINFTTYTATGVAVNDFGYDPSYDPTTGHGANWEPFWRYHWANDLFDYLSVRTPADDYLPNIPMQKSYDPGCTYYRGDLVTFYNRTATLPSGGTGPAQELYVCNAPAGTATFAGPAGSTPGAGFQRIFVSPPVKNSTDEINFGAGDADGGQAAFRTDPSVLIPLSGAALNQPYYDAHREDNVPVQGLININTADWKVLSTLPLIVDPATGVPDDAQVSSSTVSGFPPGIYSGYTFRQLNQEMAKAIVYYRDVNANPNNGGTGPFQPHGPFRSIFELNEVVDLRPGRPAALIVNPTTCGYPANTLPGFANGMFTLPLPSSRTDNFDDSLGDFSPSDQSPAGGSTGPDTIRGDYAQRNLQLTRISNMITTHSDSFTCYILVQGWRNAETNNPQLVVQRRVGYLIDRSRISPLTPDAMSVVPFPNN